MNEDGATDDDGGIDSADFADRFRAAWYSMTPERKRSVAKAVEELRRSRHDEEALRRHASPDDVDRMETPDARP